MAKPFFEVFPTLQLNGKVHDILEQTSVEKISATKRKDFLRIYLQSSRLIMKEDIWAAEREIKRQLFPNANMVVKIYEKFELSSQYTPEKLMDVYRDSILEELREYNHIDYNSFKTAEFSYPDARQMTLTLEDSVLAHSREEEFTQVLQKILVERCGFDLALRVEYREAQSGRYAEDDEQKIRLQVAEISRRAKRETGQGNSQEGFLQAEVPPTLDVAGSGASAGNSGGGSAGAGQTKVKSGGSTDGAGIAMSSTDGQEPKTGRPADKAGSTMAGASPRATSPRARNTASQGGKGGYGMKGDYPRGGYKKGEYNRGGAFGGSVKRSDNPDVIYGRDFEEEAMRIEDIIGEIGEVVIRGKILTVDKREIKNEKTIIIFDVTDFSDTMTVKMFARNDQVEEILEGVKTGAFVKIKGISMMDKFDHELTIGSLAGIKKITDFTTSRTDTAPHKRVELHCHTKMSDMDGVSEAKDIVKRAYKWGHKAIAITDHGVVQGFTDANHVWDDLWKAEKGKRKEAGEENPDKQDFFKIIYGVEAYLVDDLKEIVTGDAGQDLDADFVVFDIETTGFSPVNNRIIEIGAVKVEHGEITERFSSFVNPDVPIPFEIEKLTGINDSMVMEAPMIHEVLPKFLDFCEGCVLVAHNASFDMSFIMENCRRLGFSDRFTYVDTVGIARILLPNQAKHTLDAVAKTLGVSLENHHRAVDDAEATAHIFVKFIPRLRETGAENLRQV
ncbi:MAG: PHP domain-containing protein, partial [Acetatifactor sp.]|nr:PHP domain-containing protein [Acetatifactor sp.]